MSIREKPLLWHRRRCQDSKFVGIRIKSAGSCMTVELTTPVRGQYYWLDTGAAAQRNESTPRCCRCAPSTLLSRPLRLGAPGGTQSSTLVSRPSSSLYGLPTVNSNDHDGWGKQGYPAHVWPRASRGHKGGTCLHSPAHGKSIHAALRKRGGACVRYAQAASVSRVARRPSGPSRLKAEQGRPTSEWQSTLSICLLGTGESDQRAVFSRKVTVALLKT